MAVFTINPPNAPIGRVGGQAIMIDPTWYRFFANLQRILGNDVISSIQNSSIVTYDVSSALQNDRVLSGSSNITVTVGSNLVTVDLADTPVDAGSWGSETTIPRFTVDTKGRLTFATSFPLVSDNVTEGGTNLYFTTDRARQSLTTGTGINYSPISGVIAIDGTVATLTASQTLTNKTFNLSSNTLSGTKAQFNTACSDGDFAFLDGATFTGDVVLPNAGPSSLYSAGFRGDPVNQQVADYTILFSDAGKTIYHEGGTPHTYTIPSNASVAFPRGTRVRFVNRDSAANLTIAIASDTLRLAGSASTGSRTLAANGMAEAIKTNTTEWYITNMGGLS